MPLPFLSPYSRLKRQLEGDWGLSDDTAAAAATLITWASHYGIPITITSGKRSYEDQMRLYTTRVGVCKGCPVARPGTSKHEGGDAFDASFPMAWWRAVEWLANHAGLTWGGRFSNPDPVHFQLRR